MLRRLAAATIAVTLVFAVPRGLAAQLCVGLPSLSAHSVNLGAGGEFTDKVKSLGGRLGFGGSSAFAGIAATRDDYDEMDENSTTVTGDVGLSFDVGTSKPASVCPIASVGYTIGPDFTLPLGDVENRTLGVRGGVAFGGAAYSATGLQLVPFGMARLAYARAKRTLGGAEDTNSDTYGILSLGLGFLFSDTFMVRPVAHIPFGLKDADNSFGISFVVGF